MYLQEVIIHGFKSYATRTVVKDFDPSFNAITGLNGSGKSNVLDSICFVLGITNLSQVRASSLQELVYKGGQAGITKATVTLVFNNKDKSTAPVGYEQPDEITITRQIVIGGRNRYLINGVNAQPGRIQNLFHSVGLNVNNPHFLIMQGRITKVINMKPPEILSMIEEAAGTKMYENKKEAALRTIEKKERKVHEINSLLEDKINPSLAKLERERKHYLEWNANNNEIEALKRYIIAYRYTRACEILEKNSEGSELHQRVSAITDSLADLNRQYTASKGNVADLIKKLTDQKKTGCLEDKELLLDKVGKKLVKIHTAWENQKAALQTEEKGLTELQRNLTQQKEKSEKLRAELLKADAELTPAEENLRMATENMNQAETALLTGASSQASQGGSSGTGSLIDQLETARRAVSVAQTEIESLKQETRHLKSEFQAKSAELARDRANVRLLDSKKKSAEKAVADAKVALHELDFDCAAAEVLTEKLNEERREVAVLTERVDQLSARLESCDFRYTDPHANFDRRKVHGLVAKLIRVKDPRMTTAMEVTAGGRLYQVVVDTDSTANDLLKRGRLTRRVTILPLNKIRHEVLAHNKLRCAKQIDSSTELALTLIGYDAEVTNAIEHVFGRTLICRDMDAAKRVTFDNRVRTKTVTLEGDTYDPSGTASGGSSTRQGPSVLSLLGELRDAEQELRVRGSNMERLNAEVNSLNEKGRSFRQLQATLEVREDESKLLERQLEETSTGRLMKEVETLHKRLNEEIPKTLAESKKTLSEQSERVKDLERSMQDSAAAKRRAKQEAETAMMKVREAHHKASTDVQRVKDVQAQLTVDIESTEEEIQRLEKDLSETVGPSVEKLRADVIRVESEVAELGKENKQCEEDVEAEREQLAASNKAVAMEQRVCEEVAEKLESLSLEKAKLDSKLRESERGRAGAEQLVQDLNEQHAWIAQEKRQFGKEGSVYEFSPTKVSESSKKLECLEQKQETLAKKINKKAMHMFETAKEEYRSLIKKKEIVEQDKHKIERVIEGLDEKKMVAVEKTWRKVNEAFGNIFTDLLPGTSAKLEPPEGKTVEDGLEIRVAFGGVWKDSLSELSGGQRSLIALSLILAMLRFKPAPMYILDEVDAALDLSHTQNIGRMLRRHFSGSQFIVVSLKEGMFGNANVIFRTKFVDGVSTIKRTENDVARMQERSPSRTAPRTPLAGKENVENVDVHPAEEVGRKRTRNIF